MKKNAFTLIELLGVIVLLSILAVIIFPTIIESVRKVNNNNNDATSKLIISAAKDYYEDNKDECGDYNTCCITITSLINNNYISNDLIQNSDYNDNDNVKINFYSDGTKEYNIVNSCDN